jgi:WS/DGAT/MGAT family acyltransferase
VWLRLYQVEMGELIPKGRRLPLWWTLRRPIRPLTIRRQDHLRRHAMVPVSLRQAGDDCDAGGNHLGAVLCSLATDVADPIQRLQVIGESMRHGKDLYRALSDRQAIALSALLLSPLALTLVPGLLSWASPPFNIVISNVPGAREPLYWNGARLDGIYPMSIPMDGLAVNITVTSNADNLDVGLTGCRRTLPDMHRVLDHLEDTLTALEENC